jgi:pimeloyl-ACP methyl ester carboxylesterase
LLCSAGKTSAESIAAWKYDLRPGDHLTYRETIERESRGEAYEAKTRAKFTSHVLVTGERGDVFNVGFQRNRDSAELLAYREKGKDRLHQQLLDLNARIAKRPARFSEANEISASGEPQSYWEAARESPSKILLAVHEIEMLPTRPVAVGESWPGANLLGLGYRFGAVENLAGESCNRIEGEDAARKTRIRWWWCPGSGVLRKLELEGEYGVPGGVAHERVSFELVDRKRGEHLDDWLKSADTRQGALKGLILSPWVAMDADALLRLSPTQDPQSQGLTLALLHQRRVKVQDRGLLDSFLNGSNSELRRVAGLLVEEPAKPAPVKVGNCSIAAGSRPSAEAQKTGTTYRIVREGHSRGWPYAIRAPNDYRGDRPFPLLVYLSGGSGFAMDGVNTAEDVVSGSDYLVLYPQASGLWWEKDATWHFADTLDEVLHTFNVDTDRIYIAGFSNGATGALYFAELWPHRFAAVTSLMGAGTCNEQVAPLLGNVKHVPVLLVHGEQDPLIPSRCSSETNEALRNAGADTNPEFHILKNREHDITLETDDALTLPFLAGKKRRAFPPSLAFRVAHPDYARNYWIEADPKAQASGSVDAKIEPDNTLKITAHDADRVTLYLRPDLFPKPGPVRIVLNKKVAFQGEIGSDCGLLERTATTAGDAQMGASDRKEFDLRK